MKTDEKKPENPQAFPATDTVANGHRFEPLQQGMTLRDYFAAKAMQSIILRLGGKPLISWGDDGESTLDSLSADAYSIADAMLKQREL